eukprot:scaffold58453_cov85-Phaeocystis_antarctica.AAC.3
MKKVSTVDIQRICSAGRLSSGSGPDSPQSSSCSSSSAVLHTAASPNVAVHEPIPSCKPSSLRSSSEQPAPSSSGTTRFATAGVSVVRPRASIERTCPRHASSTTVAVGSPVYSSTTRHGPWPIELFAKLLAQAAKSAHRVELGHAIQPFAAACRDNIQEGVVWQRVQCCCRVLLVEALRSVDSLASLLREREPRLHVLLLLLEFDSAPRVALRVALGLDCAVSVDLVVSARLLLALWLRLLPEISEVYPVPPPVAGLCGWKEAALFGRTAPQRALAALRCPPPTPRTRADRPCASSAPVVTLAPAAPRRPSSSQLLHCLSSCLCSSTAAAFMTCKAVHGNTPFSGRVNTPELMTLDPAA